MADVRCVMRSLRQSPWYAATAAGVMALGITLTTTVFAVVDGVLFEPLPYSNPNELYLAYARDSTNQRRGAINVSPKDVRDWQAAIPDGRFAIFRVLGELSTFGVVNGRRVAAAFVDAAFLDTLGVRPAIGGFALEDFVVSAIGPFGDRRSREVPPSETLSALVSYGFWQRHFAGDVHAIGRIFSAPDVPQISFRLAGVLPADFVFPAQRATPEMLLPLAVPASAYDKRVATVSVIARLPESTPLAEHQGRLDATMRAAMREYPPTWQFDSVRLAPFDEEIGRFDRRPLAIVLAAAGGIVLLACVNVAGLSVARARNRQRELAIRRALGATFGDLWRLSLLEAGVLVLGASIAGVAFTYAALPQVVGLLPEGFPLYRVPAVDLRVAAFVVAVSAALTTAVAMFAARAAARAVPASAMAASSMAATPRVRTARAFVALQVGAAVVLVIGGTLLVSSLARVFGEDPGLDVDDGLALEVHMGAAPGEVISTRLQTLLQSLRHSSGVVSVGVFDAPFMRRAFSSPPVESPAHAKRLFVESIPVAADFFRTAGLKLVSGRLPAAEELDGGKWVAVVNERVAREYWPGRPAVGQRLQTNQWARRQGTFEVVGVVRDARFGALDDEAAGQMYLPVAVLGVSRAPTILVRRSPSAPALQGALIQAVAALGSPYALQRIEPLEARIRDSVRLRIFHAWLFGSFAVSALTLTAVSLFGVVATTIGQRAREIAIRMSLGSTSGAVVRLLVSEQLGAATLGLAAGTLVAAWAVRLLESYVYGTTVYDVGIWTASLVVVLIAATLGALVPAWRASGVDPVQVLRVD
jgi:putative ABC transport system permease protein